MGGKVIPKYAGTGMESKAQLLSTGLPPTSCVTAEKEAFPGSTGSVYSPGPA